MSLSIEKNQNYSHFLKFGTIRILIERKIACRFKRSVRHKFKTFGWDVGGKSQAMNCGGKKMKKRVVSKLMANLQHYRSVSILMQLAEPNIFGSKIFVRVEVSRLNWMWKKWTLYSWRKLSCNNLDVRNELRSLEILQCRYRRTICYSKTVVAVFFVFDAIEARNVEKLMPKFWKKLRKIYMWLSCFKILNFQIYTASKKAKFFPIVLERLSEKIVCFLYAWKPILFEKKGAHLSRNSILFQKYPVCCY